MNNLAGVEEIRRQPERRTFAIGVEGDWGRTVRRNLKFIIAAALLGFSLIPGCGFAAHDLGRILCGYGRVVFLDTDSDYRVDADTRWIMIKTEYMPAIETDPDAYFFHHGTRLIRMAAFSLHENGAFLMNYSMLSHALTTGSPVKIYGLSGYCDFLSENVIVSACETTESCLLRPN